MTIEYIILIDFTSMCSGKCRDVFFFVFGGQVTNHASLSIFLEWKYRECPLIIVLALVCNGKCHDWWKFEYLDWKYKGIALDSLSLNFLRQFLFTKVFYFGNVSRRAHNYLFQVLWHNLYFKWILSSINTNFLFIYTRR